LATNVAFALALEDTPLVRQLGSFDCVSGGAIVKLPAAASSSDCRRHSHPDCRATFRAIYNFWLGHVVERSAAGNL
jgi:hypothetical protein